MGPPNGPVDGISTRPDAPSGEVGGPGKKPVSYIKVEVKGILNAGSNTSLTPTIVTKEGTVELEFFQSTKISAPDRGASSTGNWSS